MPIYLTHEQLRRDTAVRDLTDPAQGHHAIQSLVYAAVDAVADLTGCDVRWCRGPRVASIRDNYDDLRFPKEAVSRDARYTRYVDGTRVLRSHSTAMVPSALRALAAAPADDVLLVCPGIVYRRDRIGRLSAGTPHQLDLWRVGRRHYGVEDLQEMIRVLGTALVPGLRLRSLRREHPYTLAGRQVDADASHEWIEVWECGLAHPEVLEKAGLAGWGGLALGMGLDRLLMLRKRIPDIRLLRSGDPRVMRQMNDLAGYQPVSAMPAIRRDLSVAIDASDHGEDLGDRVRESLGPDSDAVEEVVVLDETAYRDLPAPAATRLGIGPHQKNALIRITLRHLERTLTDDEANQLRDRVYAAIHQGSEYQWATGAKTRKTQAGGGVP